MNTNKELASRLLTYTFAAFLLCIGFDKVVQTNFISDWQLLVGPLTHFLLPVSTGSIVMVEGCIEIVLGVLLVTRFKTTALILLILTIVIVTIDLFILHYNNLAIREIILVIVCAAIYLLDEHTPELRLAQ